MTKALITGASGFIGAHLAKAVHAQGHQVVCLVRKTSSLTRLMETPVETVSGDITAPETLSQALAGVDVVYHLAGLTKALRPADLLRVNEQGTRHLAQACAQQSRPPVLVVVSSLAAAGVAPSDRLRSEADPPNPISDYGRSKRAGELAAAEFADRVPVTIVRPPMVYGEGDRDVLQMIQPISRIGIHMVPGYVTRRFSLIYAGDLATGIVLAGERGQRLPANGTSASAPAGSSDCHLGQGIYFLAGEETPTYAELGQIIAQALGRRGCWAIKSPEIFSWIAAGASQGFARLRKKPSILNLDKIREGTAGSWTCAIDQAKKDLGFAPSAPLIDHLRRTIAWYREQRWL